MRRQHARHERRNVQQLSPPICIQHTCTTRLPLPSSLFILLTVMIIEAVVLIMRLESRPTGPLRPIKEFAHSHSGEVGNV